METITPTKVKKLTGWQGTAYLWKIGEKYFVTSYVCGVAHETMMFASDENGKVTKWSDLGCVRGQEAHEELVNEYASEATRWRLCADGNTISESPVSNEHSTAGDIVCLAPVDFSMSMEHWERRRDIILKAPGLLKEVERLKSENERAVELLREIMDAVQTDVVTKVKIRSFLSTLKAL